MSAQTFDEAQHPRGEGGKFVTKPASEPDMDLGSAPDPYYQQMNDLEEAVEAGPSMSHPQEVERISRGVEELKRALQTYRPEIARVRVDYEMHGAYFDQALDADGNSVDLDEWPRDLTREDFEGPLRQIVSTPTESALEQVLPYESSGHWIDMTPAEPSREQIDSTAWSGIAGAVREEEGTGDQMTRVAEVIAGTGRPHPGDVEDPDRYRDELVRWTEENPGDGADYHAMNNLAVELASQPEWSADEVETVCSYVGTVGRADELEDDDEFEDD